MALVCEREEKIKCKFLRQVETCGVLILGLWPITILLLQSRNFFYLVRYHQKWCLSGDQIRNWQYSMVGGDALECCCFIQNCPITAWTTRQYRMRIYQNESGSKQVKNKVYVDNKYRNSKYRIQITAELMNCLSLSPPLLAKFILVCRSCLEYHSCQQVLLWSQWAIE